MIVRTRILAATLAIGLGAPTALAAADPAEAERLYRVARRLVADEAGQAADAMRAVVEADPDGPLADDARVDLAILAGAPGSPEELGRVSAAAAAEARAWLDAAAVPGADRATEARFRSALLRVEPLPGRDPAGARVDLLALATDPGAGPWALRARSALAWIEASEGRFDRAVGAWQRIRIEWPDSPEAAAARRGLAAAWAWDGRFGDAAGALVERPGPGSALRESVVRGALRSVAAGGGWTPSDAVTAVPPASRSASSIARGPGGETLLADGREGVVRVFDVSGREASRRSAADPDAVARDRFGRDWVAADDRLLRSSAAGFSPVADLDRFERASAVAVDDAGVVYVLDRKGSRIGAVSPGDASPRTLWEPADGRLVGLAWDGRRLVTADARGGALYAVDRAGVATRIATGAVEKPEALAGDGLGQIAVLDGRADAIVLLGPDGGERDRIALEATGVRRVGGIALGPDGSLDILDSSSGRVVRLP